MSSSLPIVLSSTSPLFPMLPSPLVSSCTLHQHHMHGASCMALTSSPFLPASPKDHLQPRPRQPHKVFIAVSTTSYPQHDLSTHQGVSCQLAAFLTVFSALLIPFMDPETTFVPHRLLVKLFPRRLLACCLLADQRLRPNSFWRLFQETTLSS